MDVMKFRAVVWVAIVGMGLMIGQSNGSFKDCYAKCFVFCMIEPSETLCSCTTSCLKDCIFNSTDVSSTVRHHDEGGVRILTHNFCKLGCALSTCSSFTTNPPSNVEEMNGCVGSCLDKCSNYYTLP
ncbi:unnamed protein product [Cuscuta epithymum]|uniref:Thionin-like protein 2 n=1 Tax=Cuscuta epithymum TaxID=186058 RepID=A0AAV0DPA5_9ASTE|nr:unnamed protein product [Cuscuta epithymum]CAH9126519.1 unnamed protein product [Cuscuta epithymum]CAH9140766.1 unnamed protein product [Cuscuta epithymum]